MQAQLTNVPTQLANLVGLEKDFWDQYNKLCDWYVLNIEHPEWGDVPSEFNDEVTLTSPAARNFAEQITSLLDL